MRYDAGALAYDQLTGRWSRLFASAALSAADVRPGGRLLDLATGTGEGAAAGVQLVGEDGMVAGADLSLPMLEVAREKYDSKRLFLIAADAGRLPFAAHTFDCAICLFGLMFFPKPALFLAELRRVVSPGGRIALTVWDRAERAPFAGLMVLALAKEYPSASGEILKGFSLWDPAAIRSYLGAAGFREVVVDPITRSASFPSIEAYFEPYEQGGARLGQFFLQLDKEGRQRVRTTVRNALEEMTNDGGVVSMDIHAFIATGVA